MPALEDLRSGAVWASHPSLLPQEEHRDQFHVDRACSRSSQSQASPVSRRPIQATRRTTAGYRRTTRRAEWRSVRKLTRVARR